MTHHHDLVPAWKVEIHCRSMLIGHIGGWRRSSQDKNKKVFRTYKAAKRYAERRINFAQFMMPYVKLRHVISETARAMDWRDRVRAWCHRPAIWTIE